VLGRSSAFHTATSYRKLREMIRIVSRGNVSEKARSACDLAWALDPSAVHSVPGPPGEIAPAKDCSGTGSLPVSPVLLPITAAFLLRFLLLPKGSALQARRLWSRTLEYHDSLLEKNLVVANPAMLPSDVSRNQGSVLK